MNPRSELLALVSMLLLIGTAMADRLVPGVPGVAVSAGLVASAAVGAWSILLWRREQAADPATRALSRAYLREFMPAMLVYVIAVVLSVWLLRRVDGTGLRTVVALLPVFPIALGLRATARYIRGLDELQRRIELEALALGSVALAFAYLTAGFLQSAKVLDVSAEAAMVWVLPGLSVAYCVAKRFVVRHYG
jgi:hypothetical protein